eukprot:1688711-Lingulodinium_polyedra.AAC.1
MRRELFAKAPALRSVRDAFVRRPQCARESSAGRPWHVCGVPARRPRIRSRASVCASAGRRPIHCNGRGR